MCDTLTERIAEEDTGSLIIITSDRVGVPASCKVMQLFSPLFRSLLTNTTMGPIAENPLIVSLPDFDSDTWDRLMNILKLGQIVDTKGTGDIAIDEMKKTVIKLAEAIGIKLELEKNEQRSFSVSSTSCTGLIRVRKLKDMMSTPTSAENQRIDQDDLTCIQLTRSQVTDNEEEVIVEEEKVPKLHKKKLKLLDREVSVRNLFEECLGEIEEEVLRNDDHNYIYPGSLPMKPIRIQSVTGANDTHKQRKIHKISKIRQHLIQKKKDMSVVKGEYPCATCGNNYSDPSSLRRHIKSVHEGVKHPCALCIKIYSDARGLRRHIATKHQQLYNSK